MSLEDYAPKPGRKIPHDFKIVDFGNPDIPEFLRRQDGGQARQDANTVGLRAIERAVSDLQGVVRDDNLNAYDAYVHRETTERFLQNHDRDDPALEPPIECIKFLIRKLSYREL